MAKAGASIFGSIGWTGDMAIGIFGRQCSGPIPMGSSISGDSSWIDDGWLLIFIMGFGIRG